MCAAPVRAHRRAAAQLSLGLAVLVTTGVAVLAVLGVQLAAARAPLVAATEPATATVGDVRPGGREVEVAFRDARDRPREGLLVLPDPVAVPAGTRVGVRYDPGADPGDRVLVHADGDAAADAVQDVVFGVVVVAAVLVTGVALTAGRVLAVRRLRRRPETALPATRLLVRRGLLLRSWLELDTARGPRWVPVHWSPEVARLVPGGTVGVRGDPARDRSVLPVVGGAEVWASGRVRAAPPRGDQRTPRPDPGAAPIGLARQVRLDAVLAFAAPALGLLWAYADGSGVAGFLLATAFSAGVLFWLAQLLGSDPEHPARD
ncbi:hypothetical protein SAMN06893096_10392 [Geodermatophilus pulveris]|uniref:Uncharacterized protein n=1 Tax=Geodermatophilus pulveris TaxID=1564159 RepID=A0A239DA44_9ACTN|nr:hypothetical protein [Geodermatophilus pulveris]SNS29336.1 hypothetical protein SAMN06893096_10392 [Geodermatophilus pulveris]